MSELSLLTFGQSDLYLFPFSTLTHSFKAAVKLSANLPLKNSAQACLEKWLSLNLQWGGCLYGVSKDTHLINCLSQSGSMPESIQEFILYGNSIRMCTGLQVKCAYSQKGEQVEHAIGTEVSQRWSLSPTWIKFLSIQACWSGHLWLRVHLCLRVPPVVRGTGVRGTEGPALPMPLCSEKKP